MYYTVITGEVESNSSEPLTEGSLRTEVIVYDNLLFVDQYDTDDTDDT